MGKPYANKLYQLCVWILQLTYLNLLWGLFTLAGLVILGLFPATAAAFAVTRKWVNGERDIPVFRTFISSYKIEFWKSQLLGLFILLIGLGLYAYLVFFDSQNNMIFTGFKMVMIILSIVYIMALVFIFPVFVHYKLSFYQYFKNTIFLSLVNPIPAIFSISGLGIIIFIMVKFPGLIPFFSVSAPALWITFNTQQTFKKIEMKRIKLATTVIND